MAGTTNFPTSLDTFPNIGPTDNEDDSGKEHDVVHNNEMAAIAALEKKVGVDSSAVATSLDHRVAQLEAAPAATTMYFRRDDFTAGGGEAMFTFNQDPYSDSVQLFKNGTLIMASEYLFGTGFTGKTVALLNTPATAGEVYTALYWNTIAAASATALTSSSFLVFDPSEADATVVLSNSNTRMTVSTGGWANVLSTSAHGSDKLYVEFYRDIRPSGVGTHGAGIATARPSAGKYPGGDANSWAYLSDGYIAHGGSYSYYGSNWDNNGDILMMAIDFTAGKIWFGKNGTWFASGDPVAGTNPAYTSLPTGTYKLIMGGKATSGMTSGSIQQTPTYTPPSGYLYWAP